MSDPAGARGGEEPPVSRSVMETVVEPGAQVADSVVEQPPAMRPIAGGRHEARERAVHLLYESEIKGLPVEQVLASQVLAAEPYTDDLVRGVAARRQELDALIGELARGWTLQRMPRLDVVVMRVACYELAHRSDVPRGVVLAEAVDLAGRYGTDDSAKFVNGVLSSAADRLRPE